MKILKLFWFLFLIFLINSSYSQRTIKSIPMSMTSVRETIKKSEDVVTITMPDFNVDSLLVMQSGDEFKNKFGYAFDTDFGIKNSGVWDTLSTGDKIWRLKIKCKKAISINLIYDKFWLPDGACFHLYSIDKKERLGAFTSAFNNDKNKFSTDLVKGSIVVLEYNEPFGVSGAEINVSKVIHGYKDSFSGFGDSGDCEVDVACESGDDMCIEKQAVAIILLDDNTAWCTGCLLNNATENLAPYFLTAYHCLDGDEDTWIAKFNYWSPSCDGSDASGWFTISGTTVLAKHRSSDFALLKLRFAPPSGYNVLYAGWNRTTIAPSSGFSLHHPSGDVMKVSTFGDELVTEYTKYSGGKNIRSWLLHFDEGVIEYGSSGSPLFNQNKQVIGQCNGTNSSNFISCSNPDGDAVYGRFSESWDIGDDASSRLRDWLDPNNTDIMYIGPTSPNKQMLNRTLEGTHSYAALEDISIEGNLVISGVCSSRSEIPFTAEPNADITIKAKNITINQETTFKFGSQVIIDSKASIDCDDEIISGDFFDFFCYADVSLKDGVDSDSANESIDYILDISDYIQIFPNPSEGNINVRFASSTPKNLDIYGFSGELIYSNRGFLDREIAIDLCSFPKGLYVLEIMCDNKMYTEKIIIH